MGEKLHYSQVGILVYMIQSAVTLFSIPRLVIEAFGTNGWVGIFILSFIGVVNILLINQVYIKGKGQDVLDILEENLHRVLLYPLYICMILMFGAIAVFVAKYYMFIIKIFMFPHASSNLLLFFYLLLTVYMLTKGIYNIGKITVVFFFLTIWTVFLLIVALPEFKFQRMTPHFFQGDLDIVKKGIEVYVAFLGYELVLFLFPYMEQNSRQTKAILIGHLFTTFIYTTACIVTLGFYGNEVIEKIMYPIIKQLKYIRAPFLERMEHLTLSLFLIKVVITVVMYYWVALKISERIAPFAKSTLFKFVFVFSTYFSLFLIDVPSDLFKVMEYVNVPEIILSFSLPLLLLFFLWKNKKKGGISQ
ncbi:GerAB/ArcD/ProY family transporter [Evansella sp. AB-rgal1]|uniref:GerAB/ArcD/ProY family transporter n=1 Tax=Evansella sp. AB-rgal1 TaxID=3242696 RepID=UPI00359E5E39